METKNLVPLLGGVLVLAAIGVWLWLFLPVDWQLKQQQEQPRQEQQQEQQQWQPPALADEPGQLITIHRKEIVFAWWGHCVGVTDGVTVRVLNPQNESVKIRLESIDTPELKGQPYGQDAKTALSDLIFNRRIQVLETGTDRYGRVLAFLVVDYKHVNLAMVHGGHAWHYKQYSNDPTLAAAEVKARENKRGLWALPDPVPPWEWRQQN